MKFMQLTMKNGFKVMPGNRRSQVAEMVLPPGESEGGPDNRHRGSDQWMYVVTGRGRAIVNGRSVSLKEGTLLLIERGDRHEIKNTGRRRYLQTLNFYVPPVYTKKGDILPWGRK